MDLKQVAEGAPYHLVTRIEECPLERFWVVLLSCGIEVYQTSRNNKLDEPQPWLRLKHFCQDHDCKIMSMAFARKDFNPVAQINLDPQADGYFYSEKCRKIIYSHPHFAGYEDHCQGFGELHNQTLTIHWVESTTGKVQTETRDLDYNSKSNSELALIRKHG